MDANQINVNLNKLISEIHDLEPFLLELGETQKFLALADIEVRLKALISHTGDPHPVRSGPHAATPDSKQTEIFARYKGYTYLATLDWSRINGGRGRCVLVPDSNEWLTVSAAARTVTETNVNGWRFWSYIDERGAPSPVDSIRNRLALNVDRAQP